MSRIDWKNLPPIPRKPSDGATREDLAARKFNMGKANHKGRCHLSNQKRRQIKQSKTQQAMQSRKNTDENFHEFKARVRAYWLGQAEEAPPMTFKDRLQEAAGLLVTIAFGAAAVLGLIAIAVISLDSIVRHVVAWI